jgi:hypothetical protein
MNRYRYKISLRVRHPSMDPAEITATLRFAPSHAWRAGEPRTTPRGQPLKGIWPQTYWTARLMECARPGKDLATAIAELLDQLELNRGFLARVRSEGGSSEFFVGWFFDGNSGDVFDSDLLARMADFKINLSLDVYPPDTTSVNLPIYKTIALPDGLSRIVLFDSPAGNTGRLANLMCVDHCGGLNWTAQLPKDTLPDAFISVRMEGPLLIANTSSGFAVTIDPETGNTLECVFTK